MPTFLPRLQPDELLYSALARYHVMSGNTSFKHSLKDWFGKETICGSPDLTTHLGHLCNGIGNAFTTGQLIKKHTLFPYYTLFLPEQQVMSIMSSMASGSPNTVHAQIGLRRCEISNLAYFRFCPQCVQEDEQHCGVAYWHRVHQAPGVFICPMHKVPLLDSAAVFSTWDNRRSLHLPLTTNVTKCGNPIEGDVDIHFQFVAAESQWLLCNGGDGVAISPDFIRDFYLSKLNYMGFTTGAGRVRIVELQKELVNFYGVERLTKWQSTLSGSENWLQRLVRKPRGLNHPLRHILLLNFLQASVVDLFHDSTLHIDYACEGATRRERCINPASDHFGMLVECNVSQKISKHTKRTITTFECACGYTYTKGTDKNGKSFTKVVTHGEQWTNVLMDLHSGGHSSYEMALTLGSDSRTIEKHLDQLQRASATIKDERMQVLTETYRETWLLHLRDNQGLSRIQIRAVSPDVYAWLYRNDNEWLQQSLPEKLPRLMNRPQIDWTERDRRLRDSIIWAVDTLKTLCDPPVRVTKTRIGNTLSQRYLIDKHLTKLPLSKQALQMFTESVEDFRKRCAGIKANGAICVAQTDKLLDQIGGPSLFTPLDAMNYIGAGFWIPEL